jgi:hypothetical protein
MAFGRNASIMIEMFTTSILRSQANRDREAIATTVALIAIETNRWRQTWSDRQQRGPRRDLPKCSAEGR